MALQAAGGAGILPSQAAVGRGCSPSGSAAWRSPRHGRAGGGSGAYRDPPLLNHFRLPSSHEKYKPAPGCHGAGLSCGSLKPIPPANVSAAQALPAPHGPGSASATRVVPVEPHLWGQHLPDTASAAQPHRHGDTQPGGTISPQGHGHAQVVAFGSNSPGWPCTVPLSQPSDVPKPPWCWHTLAKGMMYFMGS